MIPGLYHILFMLLQSDFLPPPLYFALVQQTSANFSVKGSSPYFIYPDLSALVVLIEYPS